MYAGVKSGSSRSISSLVPQPGYVPEVKVQFKSPKWPHRLNFYDHPPDEEMTVEEFETWAIDRLRLLADIEAAWARNRSHDELAKIVDNRAKQYLPLNSNSARGVDQAAERKKDLYSHFVLRLAFCRSEELRQRFLRAESALFRLRYESDDVADRRTFIEGLNFGWQVVSADEKAALRTELMAASGIDEKYKARFENESYFKVDWTKVADLVQSRRVFIKGGKAYVPSSSELSLVMAEFSSRLSKSLEMTAKALPRLDEDDRLLPVLEHLSMGFQAGITSDYTVTEDGEGIRAEQVPELAPQSFPMCMRALQDTLKSSKHLKHEGRQQYGLFLKGIGLSVEEAMVFWRRSFSMMTDDKFNKEYKYNIRHGYGLEGSRKNYSPRSCVQIITGKPPGPGESHGCPFRHYSEQNLSAALASTYGFSGGEVKEIGVAVKAGHYHLACTRVFELQHKKLGVEKGDGLGGGDSVDHPNRFFDRSRELRGEGKDKVKAEAGAKTEAMEVDA